VTLPAEGLIGGAGVAAGPSTAVSAGGTDGVRRAEGPAPHVWRVSSTPSKNRVDVDRCAGERDALTQQLDFQRATLLRKLEGLDDEQLRRPMTRSGLSLLGLVKHLTSTEHGWVGWPGGVSPPGSHGTVRDSLPSHGSSHPGSR